MRKSSREMDATFAFEVLDKAPYVTVSFTPSQTVAPMVFHCHWHGNIWMLSMLRSSVVWKERLL